MAEQLEERSMMAVDLTGSVGQNQFDQLDVDGDGFRASNDALLIANFLNANDGGPILVSPTNSGAPDRFFDVDGDGAISGSDFDEVIDALGEGSGGGWGGDSGDGSGGAMEPGPTGPSTSYASFYSPTGPGGGSGSGCGSASNQDPVAVDDSLSVLHGQTVSGNVLGNDFDSDGYCTGNVLTATQLSSPANGTLTFNSDGSFTYVANLNFAGVVSFAYKISDGVSDSNSATVTIDVTNNAPAAADDAYSTKHDTSLVVSPNGVLSNDSDPDGGALTPSLATNPVYGTVSPNMAWVYNSASWTYSYIWDGNFTYTPRNRSRLPNWSW